jgi:serine/threonine protein kinase
MALSDPLIGKQFGDYEIQTLLGRGGMASVYRGYDAHLDRCAAVKVIGGNLLGGEHDDEYRQRFLREARAIARLRHPNIVGVYQFGEVDNLYYMAMVFIDGRNLGQVLRDYASRGLLLPLSQVLRVVHDIAGALDYAHVGGVIHRDVKPSNIMVNGQGQAILTDFGLALSATDGTIGNTFGSAHYIAPEQAVSSANAVPQSDLYSLGVVLYQMLTGKVPFDDPSPMSVALKHLNEAPVPPRQYNPQISPDVEKVVLKALAKYPEDRYPNGEALARALELAMGISTLDDDAFATPLPLPPSGARDSEGVPTLLYPPSSLSQPAKTSQWSRRLRAEQSAPRRRVPQTAFVAGLMVVIGMVIATARLLPVAPSGAAVENFDTRETATILVTASPMPTESPVRTSTRTAGLLRTRAAQAGTPRTAVAMASDDASPTPSRTPEPTDTPTQRATARATTRPTNTPTEPDPSPTAVRTRATPTPTRTPARTAVSQARPTQRATESASGVVLIYDTSTLVLINRTGEPVNMRNLSFVQVTSSGRRLEFNSNQWLGGAGPSSRLPSDWCVQVWTSNFIELPAPPYCEERAAWRMVGSGRWFWLSPDDDMRFEVRREDVVLAECPVNVGQCVLDLEGTTS